MIRRIMNIEYEIPPFLSVGKNLYYIIKLNKNRSNRSFKSNS